MKNFSTIFLLCLIAVVGVFTLDVYLPGMPAMAREFCVSTTEIGFTFTGFSIAFAISQLFHGALSDRIGRKPILLIGLGVAAIATLFCITSHSYDVFLSARILQAVGISSFVVVNAIIRDLYTGKNAVQARTFVMTMSGISISIAPTIGGLLQNHFDWQGGFIASLLLIIIVFMYACMFYSESNINRSEQKLSFSELMKSYIKLFSDRRYLLNIIQATLAYTVHFTFIILSANLFMDLLGFTALTFGYLMFIYGGVYFISGVITTFIAKKFPIPTLIKLGGICIGAGGILMLMLSVLMSLNVWQVLIPMALMTIGITGVRTAATTGALASIPTQAGHGAAGLNLVQFMLSAFIATGISAIGNWQQYSLAFLAIVCAVSIVVLGSLLNWNSLTASQYIALEIK
jgi:Bcr/CflA subfamily drug resistance transporter